MTGIPYLISEGAIEPRDDEFVLTDYGLGMLIHLSWTVARLEQRVADTNDDRALLELDLREARARANP